MQQLNLKELQYCYSGDLEIERIMYGENLVWELVQSISLGTGSSFNLRNIVDNWQSLTASNFFVRVSGTPIASDSVTGSEETKPNARLHSQLNKSYNASTGTFSCNFQCYATVTYEPITSNNTVPCSAFLVPNLSKAISDGVLRDLGSGMSWDIRAIYPNDYRNFTINNFFISSCDECETGNRYYGGTFTFGGTASLNLSYNSSTGILNGSNYINVTNSGGGYISSRAEPIRPYIILKTS